MVPAPSFFLFVAWVSMAWTAYAWWPIPIRGSDEAVEVARRRFERCMWYHLSPSVYNSVHNIFLHSPNTYARRVSDADKGLLVTAQLGLIWQGSAQRVLDEDGEIWGVGFSDGFGNYVCWLRASDGQL